ncbi:MAG: SPFH domain-containing protein [Clostridiales bacterium]|nr:SPFH domain-containing protein [Clostridiales bacterium]
MKGSGHQEKNGIFSVIKYEGDNNNFVWKYPVEDFTMGSQLIVHETQEAVFFRDGQALDLFGPGRYTLETQNIPLVSKLYNSPLTSDSVFHSEVYFINLTTHMGVKWGTDSKIGLFDPDSGMHLKLGACGEFNIRVNDSRRLLIKLVGTTKALSRSDLFSASGSEGYFKSLITTKVKSYLGNAIKDLRLNLLEIDSRLEELSEELHKKINPTIEDYGLTISEFYLTRVVLPEDDPNFRRYRQQFADKYLLVKEEEIKKAQAVALKERKTVEAQAAVELKIIDTEGNAKTLKIQKQAEAEALKTQKQAEAESYKMKAEAEAMEMKMKGYTYQQETSRMVGLEAMQNGLGGSGQNGASALGDLAGLGVGLGAMGGVLNMTRDAISPVTDTSTQIGQNVSGIMQNAWSCTCGQNNITSNFCPNCGKKKPEATVNQGWKCPNCGKSNITSKFCPDCGTAKPQQPVSWNCTCGTQNITSKFCPNCGKKGEQ